MLSVNELTEGLAHFTGTEQYHKWSILYPRFVLTDGAHYLAENAGAYWLMDLIGSYQPKLLKKGETFQVWELDVAPLSHTATATCDDGNGRKLIRQKIPFTDFPLERVKLYAVWDGTYLVIMLPNEY